MCFLLYGHQVGVLLFLLPIEILNGGVIAHQVVLARKGLGGRRPAVRMSSMSRLATHIGGWCVIKPFRLSNCLQNLCRRPTCRFSKPPKLNPNTQRQRTSNTSRTRLRTLGFGMCRQSVTVVLAVKQVSTHSTYCVSEQKHHNRIMRHVGCKWVCAAFAASLLQCVAHF